MNTSHLDAILAKLENVRPVAGGHTARCPVHDDERNSLSVSIGKRDAVLLHCHAGCTLKQILDALGLNASALYPTGTRATRRELPPDVSDEGRRRTFGAEPITNYDWHDERGAVLYQTRRDANKNFQFRRPKPHADPGEERWIYDSKGVRLVLYRLPEVLTARHADVRIYVVEGEKDADALSRLGLAATTAPLGASAKWLKQYTDSLAGARDVVIIPDADDPGRKHAEKVRDAIISEVETLRVLELPDLPPSGDVSDFLAAGGTRDALEKLADAAPVVADPSRRFLAASVPGDVFLARKFEKPRSILGKGLLSAGEWAFLYGHPGLGKSWAGIQIAYALARGNGPLGIAGPDDGPARVGLLELELSGYWYRERSAALLDGDDPSFLANVEIVARPDLKGAVDMLGTDRRALSRWILDERLDFVVIDALSRAHNANENVGVEISPVLQAFDDICERTGAAILVIHHEPKPPVGGKEIDDLFALRGNSRMISDPKALIRLAKAKQPGLFQLRFPKANNAPDAAPVWLSRTACGAFQVEKAPEERRNENAERVQRLLEAAGPDGLALAEILETTGLPKSTLTGARGVLHAIGATPSGTEYEVRDSAGRRKKHRKWSLDRGQRTTEDENDGRPLSSPLPTNDLAL